MRIEWYEMKNTNYLSNSPLIDDSWSVGRGVDRDASRGGRAADDQQSRTYKWIYNMNYKINYKNLYGLEVGIVQEKDMKETWLL